MVIPPMWRQSICNFPMTISSTFLAMDLCRYLYPKANFRVMLKENQSEMSRPPQIYIDNSQSVYVLE